DTKEPDAERRAGRGALFEGRQGAERRQEDALGQVLRVMVIAQLVEGEAVHLGQVLPIEDREPLRVSLRRPDGGPVDIDPERIPLRVPPRIAFRLGPRSSKHRGQPFVTPAPAPWTGP